MGEIIFWCIINGLCGALFFGIGVYAKRLQKPMWFWSGTEVNASEIKDVGAYNRANAAMWKCYGALFFLAAVLRFFGFWPAMIAFILAFTVGTPLLVVAYSKIYKKYKAK